MGGVSSPTEGLVARRPRPILQEVGTFCSLPDGVGGASWEPVALV